MLQLILVLTNDQTRPTPAGPISLYKHKIGSRQNVHDADIGNGEEWAPNGGRMSRMKARDNPTRLGIHCLGVALSGARG